MGLFILFKKISNTLWGKKDGSPILDNDIPALITKGLENAEILEKNSLNPKFHRTEREEDLAFNFSRKYHSEVSQFEDSIYESVSKIKSCQTVEDKIKQSELAISTFERARKFCYSKGKGGRLYFDDMWEHCHNSKNPCFSFIEETVALKAKLELKLYNQK